MRQYQVVITTLQNKTREDEELLTDLLNERERTGWSLHSTQQVRTGRLALIFAREA